jgi:hypothetical protein
MYRRGAEEARRTQRNLFSSARTGMDTTVGELIPILAFIGAHP